jgi:hypothetical protein
MDGLEHVGLGEEAATSPAKTNPNILCSYTDCVFRHPAVVLPDTAPALIAEIEAQENVA